MSRSPFHFVRSRRLCSVAALCAVVCCSRSSFAHVQLDTPTASQVLTPGTSVKVTWEDLILHDGLGYDLDFLPNGLRGDLVPIVHGLPVTQHSYTWTVPDACRNCDLEVTQVNADHSYQDWVLLNFGASTGSGGEASSAGGSLASAGTSSASGGVENAGGMQTADAGGAPNASGASNGGETATVGSGGNTTTSSADSEAGSTVAGAGAGTGAEENQSVSAASGRSATHDSPEAEAGNAAGESNHASGGCAVSFTQPSRVAWLAFMSLLFAAARRKRRAPSATQSRS